MVLKKWHKIAIFLILLCGISGLIYYFNLSNRHKAIVKTRVLHYLHLIDPEWNQTNSNETLVLESPTFLIDNIYKSMEGPKAIERFCLDATSNDLLFMTGFKVEAISAKGNHRLSNDFICHINIDYIEQEHHGRWNMLQRINSQYPRLLSLSHGIESSKFPEGYGFPFFSNETFMINAQALNHNVKDSVFQIKHDISINYSNDKNIKPLRPKTVFMMLPFNINDPYNTNSINNENSCVPLETKNHTYFDEKGQAYSGHWKIFEGKQEFKYNITEQLALKDTVRLHQIIPHLHPFATKLALIDLTSGETIYNCNVINHKDNIGLTKTPDFSSKQGIFMVPSHEYQIELTTNNTTKEPQDMMASMFLFFYDNEMALKIKDYQNAL